MWAFYTQYKTKENMAMTTFISNHKKIFIYLLLAAAIAGIAVTYFGKPEETVYITEDVKRQNIEKVVNATGEVRAIELVTVGAQVSGKIEKLYVTIGQNVKKGDLIAEIDSTTQQNEVDINKAKLNSYEAQLVAAQTTLKIADKQYKRLQTLKKRNAASDEDLENAQETYETAKSKVTELESSLKETQISLSTAETNLGYTKITAPLDGTIVSIPVKQGQTINAAMDTPTIVQIADLTSMEILIEISEGDIGNIKPGIKVTYTILADLNDIQETTLKSIDPGLTLLTNAEYTEVVDEGEAIYYYGRLVVPNDNGKLRIGMTTQNVLYVESAENVLTVPATAIKNNGDGKYVEILTPNGVQQRHVITGISDGLNIEVKSGINEGEQIIIARMSSSEISDKTSKIRGPRGF
jgi:efflux transporter, RND family, MFP subunit